MKTLMHTTQARAIAACAISLALAACGGSGSSSSSSGPNSSPSANMQTYTIGGTVAGLLSGASVTLTNSEGDTLTTSENGPFAFKTALNYGVTYTVSAQSSSETCTVSSGSGTVTGDTTAVSVQCAVTAFAWMSGSNIVDANGVYGQEYVPSGSNAPGGRFDAAAWTDASGNLWLFGGMGYDLAGGLSSLNDVWKYSPASGLWTWDGGSSGVSAKGVYGTQGTAAASNIPGARFDAATWTDKSGNFWLFGGSGYDSTGALGDLNDLWKYSPASGLWTWESGSNTAGTGPGGTGPGQVHGVYGTEGTAAASNIPGPRVGSLAWTGAGGNLWMFGGFGYDSAGNTDPLNDLWTYSTATGLWTWESGSNTANEKAVYGTQGTAAASNIPGARYDAVPWTDASGNLWLFGGQGTGVSSGSDNEYNDLWMYSLASGLWTWEGGSSTETLAGVYGTEGVAAASNFPGARVGAVTWTDANGNLWLCEGSGYDSTFTDSDLNDLWMYSPASNLWAWEGGSSVGGAKGVYGTQGIAAASNFPGARSRAVVWTDTSGNLWLLGGYGYDSAGNVHLLNDLWKLVPR